MRNIIECVRNGEYEFEFNIGGEALCSDINSLMCSISAGVKF